MHLSHADVKNGNDPTFFSYTKTTWVYFWKRASKLRARSYSCANESAALYEIVPRSIYLAFSPFLISAGQPLNVLLSAGCQATREHQQQAVHQGSFFRPAHRSNPSGENKWTAFCSRWKGERVATAAWPSIMLLNHYAANRLTMCLTIFRVTNARANSTVFKSGESLLVHKIALAMN